MQISLKLSGIVLGLALVVLIAGCPVAGPGGTNAGKLGARAKADFKFTRKSTGLPSTALDFVGGAPTGLSGCRQSGQVFFAVARKDDTGFYVRDLRSGKRRELKPLPPVLDGSIGVSANARYAVYCRPRKIDTYFDDPAIKDPAAVAQVFRTDLRSGAEVELFNFREPAWRAFRADKFTPFISDDGNEVVALTYNYEKLLLAKYLSDWVQYEARYRANRAKMKPKEISEFEKNLRLLTSAEQVAPMLKDMGVTPSTSGIVPPKERAAMAELAHKIAIPEVVLLIWQDGKARILPVKTEKTQVYDFYYVIAITKDAALLGYKNLSDKGVHPQRILKCNLQTGAVSPFVEFTGMPGTIEVDRDQQTLLMVYNPYDATKKQLLNESHLARYPLDGSASTDTKLPGDFLAFIDITSDGKYAFGQESNQLGLYLIDIAAGTKSLLMQPAGAVAGVFIEDQAKRVAYLDQGILFSIKVVPNPETSQEWIGDSYFAKFRPKFDDFLSKLGYQVPADAVFHMEELDGMGKHEVAVEISLPSRPNTPALLKLDVVKDRVFSMWFPGGCPFTAPVNRSAKKLDYYACEKITSEKLAVAGWMPGNTHQIYQPGPNPLYDGTSNTFIVDYRDGYWLGSGKDAKWAVNREATLRISAADGQLTEMTLLDLPQVKNQPLKITMDKAKFIIRNQGAMKLPEKAPIRFEEKNVRYAVVVKPVTAFGPAEYNSGETYRLCYEIDMFIMPEDLLICTSRVDTETGDLLGQINYQPESIAPVGGG